MLGVLKHTYMLGVLKHAYKLGKHTYTLSILSRCEEVCWNIDLHGRLDPERSEPLMRLCGWDEMLTAYVFCSGAPTLITIRTETFAHTEPRSICTAARPSPHLYLLYDVAAEAQHCSEPSRARNPSTPMVLCEIDRVHPLRQLCLVSNCPEEGPWCRCPLGPLCPRTPIPDEGRTSVVPPR